MYDLLLLLLFLLILALCENGISLAMTQINIHKESLKPSGVRLPQEEQSFISNKLNKIK